MKRRFRRMRRRSLCLPLSIVCLLLLALLGSCAASSAFSRFSLDASVQSSSSNMILTGSIGYGAGFYFPSSSDILDVSLLKTDATTGTVSEISHQRIRNIQRFPIQFTVRYNGEDVHEGDSCMVFVTLSTNGEVSAQGFGQLSSNPNGFNDVSVMLTGVGE